VVVQGGAIRELPLPAKAARVLSVLGSAVVVCGDVPQLGDWDLRHAPRLEYVNADTWFNEIPFAASAGQPICFRFAVIWQEAAASCCRCPAASSWSTTGSRSERRSPWARGSCST
jgi:hypothetical protein